MTDPRIRLIEELRDECAEAGELPRDKLDPPDWILKWLVRRLDAILSTPTSESVSPAKDCICHSGSVCGEACAYAHHGGCPRESVSREDVEGVERGNRAAENRDEGGDRAAPPSDPSAEGQADPAAPSASPDGYVSVGEIEQLRDEISKALEGGGELVRTPMDLLPPYRRRPGSFPIAEVVIRLDSLIAKAGGAK